MCIKTGWYQKKLLAVYTFMVHAIAQRTEMSFGHGKFHVLFWNLIPMKPCWEQLKWIKSMVWFRYTYGLVLFYFGEFWARDSPASSQKMLPLTKQYVPDFKFKKYILYVLLSDVLSLNYIFIYVYTFSFFVCKLNLCWYFGFCYVV